MNGRTYATSIILFGMLCTANLNAQSEVKKVIITPIYNHTNSEAFRYLTSTITNAIRKNLNANFSFVETPERKWKKVLRKNEFIFENEYHTHSVALQNGLLNKQDVVIGGFFDIEQKGPDGQRLAVHIFLLDIREKKSLMNLWKRHQSIRIFLG